MGANNSTQETTYSQQRRRTAEEERWRTQAIYERAEKLRHEQRKKADEEARQKAAEEARKRAAEEARKRAAEEAGKRAEEERKRKELLPEPKELKRIDNILWDTMSTNRITSHWYNNSTRNVVEYVDVEFHSEEVQAIVQMFKIRNGIHFIDRIERVENPLLLASYLLRKKELEQNYKYIIREELLFHGTSEQNVYEICEQNFDRRLTVSTHSSGGIEFMSRAGLASCNSDKYNENKKMLVVRVLVGNIYDDGIVNIVPDGYDTVSLKEGEVIVKYDDNEFYPAYVITYHRKQKRT